MNDKKCTYCGYTSECREHVIPVAYLGLTRSYDSSINWIVPSCNRCNEFAGSVVFFSIPEKAEFILKSYRKKYKLMLLTEEWEEHELIELDYLLIKAIEGQRLLKEVVNEKILYLEKIQLLEKEYLMPDFIKTTILDVIKEYKELTRIRKNTKARLLRKQKKKALKPLLHNKQK